MSRTLAILLTVAAGARAGEPAADKYPFAVPPLEILDRLGKADLGSIPVPNAADRAFLEAVWTARSKPAADQKPPSADDTVRALLLAAGVSTPAAREKYGRQFDALTAQARKAVGAGNEPRQKADKLLRFLHAGPMKNGYVGGQSSLPAVLDTGKFNCVSSAALYHVVGRRLGLDLRVILIPGGIITAGHASIDLVDGKDRVQIEPTNPDGFDWPAKRDRPGVVVFGVEPDRKDGYEADALGLAASTAANRAAEASRAEGPSPARAVELYLIALALHPTNRMAAHNLNAEFAGWGSALAGQGKADAALRLFAVAAAASDDRDLRDHHTYAWRKAIDAELDAGHLKAGLALIGKAAAAVPAEPVFGRPADLLAAAAGRKRKADGWDAGIAYADRGLKLLPEENAADLRRWRSGAYRQWSQEHLEGGDHDASLKVLAAGLAATPKDFDLLLGLEYHVHQALKTLSTKDPEAAAAHFRAVAKAFPADREVKDAGVGFVRNRVIELAEATKFAEAVKAAQAGQPFAGDATPELIAEAFDRWARHLAGHGDWEPALAKYAEGLKAVPGSDRLTNNAVVTVLERAEMKKDNPAEAVRVIDVGLKYFPKNDRLERAREAYRAGPRE
jgi:hypothetical protein